MRIGITTYLNLSEFGIVISALPSASPSEKLIWSFFRLASTSSR